jgi:hypothetical protein
MYTDCFLTENINNGSIFAKAAKEIVSKASDRRSGGCGKNQILRSSRLAAKFRHMFRQIRE